MARKRLHALELSLAQFFGLREQTKERKQPDQNYAEFRADVKRQGLTYKLARDHYIELSNGRMFPHHGDWAESLERLRSEDE